MRKAVVLIVLLLTISSIPTVSDALNVTITFNGASTTLTTTTLVNGKTAILIAGSYNGLTIATCTTAEGCSGNPARVFVDPGGSVANLALTDAKFTGVGSGTISFASDTGDLQSALVDGTYPYAIAMNGAFIGTGARNNSISFTAFANAATDSPTSIGTLTAPAFTIVTLASATFANKQATASIPCPPPTPIITKVPHNTGSLFILAVDTESTEEPFIRAVDTDTTERPFILAADTDTTTNSLIFAQALTCDQSLRGQMPLSLVAGTTTRLPGSINVLASNVTEDNGGLALLTATLAALHPGANAKVIRASLEPSPGHGTPTAPIPTITIRGVMSSPAAWVVDREGNGESKARVEITTGGTAQIKVDGFCPAAGCAPATLDISVACAESAARFTFPGALTSNSKGDGEAKINLPTLPCTDPTLLLEDSTGWVAAIGVF